MSREDETACAAAFGAAGELVGTADAREEEAVFGAGAPDELSSPRGQLERWQKRGMGSLQPYCGKLAKTRAPHGSH